MFAKREGATEADRAVAACMSSYSEMLRVMSEGQHILTVQEAAKLHNPGFLREINIYFWWIRGGCGPTVSNRPECMETSRSMH